MSLVRLAEADRVSCGGKAAGLRSLLELGLPVPEAVCLPFALYRRALPRELPGPCAELARAEVASRPVREALLRWTPGPRLRAALEEALARLAAPTVAVRSSASCEDADQPSAGLFASSAGVRGMDALLEAVRRCWASLWEVPAWAGLRLGGRSPAGEAMAVIVQTEVEARWGGLLLSRDPAEPRRLRLEAVAGSGAGLAAGERDPEVVLLLEPAPGPLPSPAPLPAALLELLRASAVRVEASLGGPVELEWAFDGERPWLLQARRSERRPAPRAFPVRWRRPEEAELRWRWDREHNPDPLSPAHRSLIERLEEDGPPRLMVQGGYLYYVDAAPGVESGEALGALWERLCAGTAAAEDELERHAGDPRAALARALESFRSFYATYAGPLASARRRARAELRALLAARGAAGLEPALLLGLPHATQRRTEELWQLARRLRDEPTLRSELRRSREVGPGAPAWLRQGLAEHLARYGCLTRRWDLASPSLAEQPAPLLDRLLSLADLEEDPARVRARAEEQARRTAEELRAALPAEERARLDARLEAARLARRLEEDDDLVFARALGLLRRALLRAGDELRRERRLASVDEVFLLTLDEVSAALDPARPPPDLAGELATRRRALEESRELQPPLTIQGDRLTWLRPPGRVILRGAGVGGLARGPVRLAGSLEELLGLEAAGAVVVCPTLLPSLAVVLAEAAALVTDHGGLLSHAASLARELGVPAVVGTGSATRELRPGEVVWVDGSRGLVVREGT